MLICILFLISSCKEESKEVDFYFDSSNYINQEIDSLYTKVKQLEKKIELNGELEIRDSLSVDSTTFDEMSKFFEEANINKGIYLNEYRIDTFWQLDPISNENVEILNYVTDNPELKVRWMQVYSDGSLKALMTESNTLFSYEKEAFYAKGKKFSIISWQKSLAQDTIHIFKEAQFE